MSGHDMIRNEVQLFEPESRDLVKDFALVRDRVGQDTVESRDPVGGHEEEMIAEIENLTHLAAAKFRNAGKIARKQLHDAVESMRESRRTESQFSGPRPLYGATRY
jgi:hypothetical protein